MFVVRFSDGLTIETWRDELSPHRHTEAPE
jgi:hypothetical protein